MQVTYSFQKGLRHVSRHPGRVLEVYEQDNLPMGKVDFIRLRQRGLLAYTPEAEVGDYVLIHVGFAISRIDEQGGQRDLPFLDEIGLPEWPKKRPRRSGGGHKRREAKYVKYID